MLDVPQLLFNLYIFYFERFGRRTIVHEADHAIIMLFGRFQFEPDHSAGLRSFGYFTFIARVDHIVVFFVVVEHILPAIFADIVIIDELHHEAGAGKTNHFSFRPSRKWFLFKRI